MKSLSIIVISLALLPSGCGSAAESAANKSNAAKMYPLECSGCDYVEDKGGRTLVGNVWNVSNKTEDLCLDIEERDAAGKIVDKIYNLSLSNRSVVEAQHSVPFEQGLDRRASITQITFYLRERDRNDVKATPDQMLSPAYTRQLHTMPVPEGVTVPSPEP